jgi:hypothetical protein
MLKGFAGYHRIEVDHESNSGFHSSIQLKLKGSKRKEINCPHIGDRVTKLTLIKLIIEFWCLKETESQFDSRIMPWLKMLTQKPYESIWDKESWLIHGWLLRCYIEKRSI